MKKLFLLFVLFIFLIIQERVCFPLKSQFKKETIFVTFPYFQLISLREKMAEIFIFGPYDKAGWLLTLSEKRLFSAEKALACNCPTKTARFLKSSQTNSTKAAKFLRIARMNGEDTNFLEERTKSISNRQKDVLLKL